MDDYLYALQTEQYLDALTPDPRDLLNAWEASANNSPLVPMLAVPAAAVSTSPHVLVLVQILPLLVLLGSARSLLIDLTLTARASWIVAALITVLPPVMGYAAMYHFGLAATACTMLAAAVYARSDRLARRRPALLVGLAVGLLLLTRVLAPVYVAALFIPIVIDVVASKADRARRLRNGAWAALLAGAVAAPWWLVSGDTAVRYLVSAAYRESPFTRDASPLDTAAERLTWTANESGWLLGFLLLALVVWSLVCIGRRVPAWRLLAWLLATSCLGLLLLASSSNKGTAFALPFVALVCCAAAAGVVHMKRTPKAAIVAIGSAALVLPALALVGVVPTVTVAGHPLWQAGIPGMQQARAALGCDCDPPDTDVLSRQVLDVIGSEPTLLVRDDVILNANGLRYNALQRDLAANLSAPSGPGQHVTGAELSSSVYVLSGSTAAPYQLTIDPAGLRQQLLAAGFRPVLNRRLSKRNGVVLWRAATDPSAERQAQ